MANIRMAEPKAPSCLDSAFSKKHPAPGEGNLRGGVRRNVRNAYFVITTP